MSEVNYYFGKKGMYEDVLLCLSTTRVNTLKTSSLPLAQFWKPSKKLSEFINRLKNEANIDVCDGDRYFEYPTECLKEGKKLSNSFPSMTDLMILNDSFRIAIEGKYTEYSKSHYETIKEWNKDKASYKKDIKDQWFEYIKNCGATKKNSVDEELPYQFLHRAASACYDCEMPRTPVLVYQLFFDSENRGKKNEFVEKLKEWAKVLGFTNKIKFLITGVEIKNIKEVEETYKGLHSEMFLVMRESKNSVYEFDWDNIEILNCSLDY